MPHLPKDILTRKITEATKGSDIFDCNFVLFVRFTVKLPSNWFDRRPVAPIKFAFSQRYLKFSRRMNFAVYSVLTFPLR